jgi:dTDP-glucose pyrophosphorylase
VNNLILSESSSFEEAVSQLNDNGYGFLAVVDRKNKLVGIITDGDVRRAFLNGGKKLIDVINTEPTTMKQGSSKESVLYQLRQSHRKHMPLVDEDGYLLDIVMLDEESYTVRSNWIVIMAGGLGSRLGALTTDTPKPMLNLGGKPMIERIINLFKLSGFTKFMISVNYKSEIIKSYFKDGSEFGIEIIYLEEKTRLGTAGALSLINLELLEDTFFVVNGDVISSLNYDEMLKFHKDSGADATMCVKETTYQIPYGVIKVDKDNNIIDIQEKPTNNYYINAGIYACEPNVLSLLNLEKHIDMPDFFRVLNNGNKIIKTFLLEGSWSDVGIPEEYHRADKQFSPHG